MISDLLLVNYIEKDRLLFVFDDFFSELIGDECKGLSFILENHEHFEHRCILSNAERILERESLSDLFLHMLFLGRKKIFCSEDSEDIVLISPLIDWDFRETHFLDFFEKFPVEQSFI